MRSRRDDEALVRAWQARRPNPLVASLGAEMFAEQRAFNEDPARLIAAICGRRAGKTRGRNRAILRNALGRRGYQALVINETRNEVRRLNWIGTQGDGIASTVKSLKIPAKIDEGAMTIHLTEVDSWIRCIGVDDEAAIGKALGGGNHEVWWDEGQKVPARFYDRIREVFMPTLLDFGGRFILTGTPSRQRAGLFWLVTQPELGKRLPGWSVHHWTALHNPWFGRVEVVGPGLWRVIDKMGNQDGGLFRTLAEAEAHAIDTRYRGALLDLQFLYGGADVAPMDGPLMMREGKGIWSAEASAYTYSGFHRAQPGSLFYAKQRWTSDLFVDWQAALEDLPGWGKREYFTSLGADLGFRPDPFAVCVWAWCYDDPCLYEVGTWKANDLDSDQQAAILRTVREIVRPGVACADAGGSARPTVAGWSKEWLQRYNIPLEEAVKANKNPAIEAVNADMCTLYEGKPRLRLRDGSPLADEYSQIQWASVRSASGRQVEDPSIPNDCADAGLYGHRIAWHHRWIPKQEPPPPEVRVAQEEEALRERAFDPDLQPILGWGN